MTRHDPPDVDAIVAELRQSRKYHTIGICDDTIRDIVITELARQKNPKAAIQSARKKLHEVVALYLGDPDYTAATRLLEAAFASGDPGAVRGACADILRAHDSTRERLPLLDTFYPRIFAVTGLPQVVLDVACGLNPLALPWMGLPPGVRFLAYDIHQQRVDFLNRYFALQGVEGTATMQDILVHYPRESGDVALLLKEIHRMEKRRRGIVLPLLDALHVRWIVLSSPTHSRTGRHDVTAVYRQQVHAILANRPWPVTEIEFANELVYCVRKSPA
jgi:16S rRNA (guanine(1405)-N(7))-methyltransferase